MFLFGIDPKQKDLNRGSYPLVAPEEEKSTGAASGRPVTRQPPLSPSGADWQEINLRAQFSGTAAGAQEFEIALSSAGLEAKGASRGPVLNQQTGRRRADELADRHRRVPR